MLASGRKGTLYVGVTSDLCKRVWQHKAGAAEGFTRKYGVKHLVWYEMHGTMENAIRREKQIKKWKRSWKIREILDSNPDWKDLYETLCVN